MVNFWSPILIKDFRTIDKALLDTWRDKTIVISGATGFVGSLLARLFIWANAEYSLNVQLILVARSEKKLHEMFDSVRTSHACEYVIRDFSTPCELLTQPFELLIHTAAITNSKKMIENPVGVLDVTYNGVKWAMESSREVKNSKVIYLSSMEANGSFDNSVVADEKTLGLVDLSSVRSCYPEGKRMAELYCKCYAEQYGMNVTIGRLAQTFGAGILPNEDRVFKQFAVNAIKGEDIVLHTDGMSEGNYVYSSDALSAILILSNKGEAGETYNIANEECHTTILNMAKLVANNFSDGKSKLVIESQDSNQFGYASPTHMTLSSEKLRSVGWMPTKNLKESYESMISFLTVGDV